MTQKKDLKRRVRERMAKTGERYAAALRQVTAKVEPELEADSYLIKAPFKCQLMASREVYRRVLADQGAGLAARVAEVVKALESDPAGVLFQRAVAGEVPGPRRDPAVLVMRWGERLAERARYVRRLELGLRGVSGDGCILTFDFGGEVVVASLSLWPKWSTISLETREEFLQAREALDFLRSVPIPRVG
jgi:hypothetical protein